MFQENILAILTIIAFASWQGYWWITERKADQEKPKTSHKINYLEKHALLLIYIPLMLQLLGIKLFFTPLPFSWQLIGFLFVLIGIGIAVSGRIALGTNWTHAAEYQIKKEHSLVTTGIYRFIRNPIYTGLLFAVTGAVLVAQLSFPLLFVVAIFFWAYRASKREEKILEPHFGKAYTDYKKHTKMLIPFII